jgi:hypothetical protein
MKDVTGYATAEVTPTMAAFADYLIAEVFGGTLPKGMHEATFRKAVALGGSTRGYFQKSEFWQNDSRNYLANVEKNRAAKIAESIRKAEEADKKRADRLAALRAKLAEAEAKAAAANPVADDADEDADEDAA